MATVPDPISLRVYILEKQVKFDAVTSMGGSLEVWGIWDTRPKLLLDLIAL